MNLLRRLRERFGDFWWYAAIIFIACRSGDAIQAFIGLWLVPRYVPQSELGAALPLLYVGGVFGLPLSILVVPFSRWLTIYVTRGEFGKVKRLLQTAFFSVFAVFAGAALIARCILPCFFERMRLTEGSLGLLVICAGLAGPLSTVFCNALQGLKRFNTLALVNAIGAPVRLVVMLVAMPFRALSGYMLGQVVSPGVNVAIAWFALRKELGRGVKGVPLGREDLKAMFRYTLPVACNICVVAMFGAFQALLVRQRLSDVDSAAFYIVTRLADITAYAGASLSMVVFPLAAEARENGEKGNGLLFRLLGGTFAAGLAVTVLLACCGKWLLGHVQIWSGYVEYWPMLAVFALRTAIVTTNSAFSTYETAAGRFSFLWYLLPLTILETAGLAALTGYGFFYGILPDCVVDWMASLSAGRLEFFAWWLLCAAFVQLAAVVAHIVLRRSPGGRQTRRG